MLSVIVLRNLKNVRLNCSRKRQEIINWTTNNFAQLRAAFINCSKIIPLNEE